MFISLPDAKHICLTITAWILVPFGIYFASHTTHPDWYTHFVYQAWGFLQGRFDIWNLPSYITWI